MIYFITGGERSGKSRFAQDLALKLSDHPVYLATARKWDGDFEKRIERHQTGRDARWQSIEEEVKISDAMVSEKVIVLDCITLWLTNIFMDCKNNTAETLEFVIQELDRAFQKVSTLIVISNEIGMGVHAATEMGRKFTELQGWVNQHIAEKADHAYLMISGIPVKVKPSGIL